MEVLQFSALVDNMEKVLELDKLDNKPGMDRDPGEGSISLTPAALQGKPYTRLDACSDGSETVIIHKSAGDKQSYEMSTSFNGGPAYLIANQESGGQWHIGSNLLVMKDGMVETTESGIPKCNGEFLIAG